MAVITIISFCMTGLSRMAILPSKDQHKQTLGILSKDCSTYDSHCEHKGTLDLNSCK